MSAGASAHDDGALDSLFRALAHRRRRETVRLLSNQDGPLTTADLAKMIATEEQNAKLVDIDGDEVNAIYKELYHWHLPKLADCGIISHRGDRGAVALSEQAEAATTIIETVEGPI